ncbi:type II toxin-antitoxin system RelE/ParE family toxin [Thermococcus sp. MV5]|uniref:type II toxin-antitoxin system RelE family toxin n=1 Tax=Thermococcus sp. MV5 TaxID=1638272 RepID=UPI001439B832|nr:type II toxin-antitoxin system RelE/ParE family toxin [Thermococcus sp. MV5]NJE26323.1 type II toxin-antitoxin system RelE/ParE family toxin [Thermococcus sp. MV5]
MYEIIFTKKAAKQVQTLEKAHMQKLKEILLSLRENPFSYPYKKIRGEENIYRIRVGKFRILYEVNDKDHLVIIFKIERRERAYKRK